jgi:hypothetical protein
MTSLFNSNSTFPSNLPIDFSLSAAESALSQLGFQYLPPHDPMNLLYASASPCAVANCYVGIHSRRGRVLFSSRAIACGELILRESPLFYANWDEFRCLECDLPHIEARCAQVKAIYGNLNAKRMNLLVQELAEIPGIDEIDRARCLVKTLNQINLAVNNFSQSHNKKGNKGSSSVNSKGFEASMLPEAIQSLLKLTGHKLELCVESINQAKQLTEAQAAGLFLSEVTQQLAPRVLSILNTNSHELNDILGCGLFIRASLFEHSCFPNSNFSNSGKELCIYALADIPPHTPLTIDYGNFMLYQPIEDRRQHLLSSYGFHCDCVACTQLPELCRAFKCPTTANNSANIAQNNSNCSGLVYAAPPTSKFPFFPCTECKTELTIPQAEFYLQLENHLHQQSYSWRVPPDEDEEELGQNNSFTDEVIDFKSIDFDKPFEENKNNSRFATFGKVSNDSSPQTVFSWLSNLLSSTPLHRSHYILFWSYDRLATALARVQESRSTAELIVEDQLRCLELVLRPHNSVHDEICNYLDSLAQLKLTLGKAAEAQKLWMDAAKLSATINGKESSSTEQLQGLANQPPKDLEELEARYKSYRSRIEQIAYEAEGEGYELLGLEQSHDQDNNNNESINNNNLDIIDEEKGDAEMQ